MPNCPRCGAEVGPADGFCRGCGVQLAQATQVMPPVQQPVAAGQPGAKPDRVKIALAALVVLLLLLLVGGGVWVFARNGQPPVKTASVVETASVEPTATASQATTVSSAGSTAGTTQKPPAAKPPAPKPSTAEDGTHFTFVNSMPKSGAGYRAVLDYMQVWTGQEAWDEAAKRGKTAENDIFTANDSTKLRTFPVASGVTIVLHPGEGPNYSRTFTRSEFVQLLESGDVREYGGEHYFAKPGDVIFKVTIKDGVVTRIENFWTP